MNPNPGFLPHPMPNFRYRPWEELSSAAHKVAANTLGYTKDKWNNLGTALVERNTFLNLKEEERQGAMDLGFYVHTWDCFMNHYAAYYWSSFHEDLKVAIETLGWTEDLWASDGQAAPDSERKAWALLTPEEKAAATRLCFFEETWDASPLPAWYDYDAEQHTAMRLATGPVPQDIDLGIFEDTGYAGQAPGSVGAVAYTVGGPQSGAGVAFASARGAVWLMSAGLLLLV